MIFPSEVTELYNNISSMNLRFSMLVTICAIALFAIPAIKKNWLSKNALITTTAIAILLVIYLGIGILLFPFLFAIIGSLISKKENSTIEKNGRSAMQVIANAGVAIIFVIALNDSQKSIPLVIFVFAIAMSDTMSSEIGKRFKGATYDICSFKKIEPGLSGGISTIGTLAGLMGSLIIALAALLYSFDFRFSMSVCLIGFLGMLVDSLLGSTAQGKYLNGNKIKDRGSKENLVSGFHFFDNELTNFVSIFITICFVYLLASVL